MNIYTNALLQLLTLENILMVVFSILLIVVILYLDVVTRANIKKWAEALIVYVEKELSTESGKEKFEFVCDTIWNNLPHVCKIIITKKHISTLVQWVFDSISSIVKDEEGVPHTVPFLS